MEDIKVSVLTPIYNHSLIYVRQCLDSLKAQTMQDIEFILIDNGAPEDAKRLISEYESMDSRFRVIHFAENQGYGKAMNAGLDAARGEYIGIVESDDWVEPVMYEELYKIGVKNNVEVVKSKFYYYQNNKKRISSSLPNNLYNCVLTNVVKSCPQFAIGHVSHWSAIYKKLFLDCNNIKFNEDITTGIQDFGFINNVFLHISTLYLIDRAYINYRMDNPNSSIQGKYKMVKKVINEHLYVNKMYEDANASLEYWEVNAKGKFLSLEYHRHQNCKYHELEILMICSDIYRYLLDVKKVKLTLFSDTTRKIFKDIAYHPFIFILKSIYKNTITTPKSTKIKYFGGIFKKKIENNIKSYYILGIKCFYKRKIFTFPVKEFSKQNYINTLMLKTLIQCQTLHKETFGPYKNAFNDKTVVLVASGPTAQYHIQKENAIYVGVNNACLLEKVKLDYLFCQDFYMNEEKRNAIVNYRPNKCKKFFGRISDERIRQCHNDLNNLHVTRCPKYLIEQANAKEYYVCDFVRNEFCQDIENEPLMAGGIAFSAMQFILHAHPKKIYLVGCDCSSGFFYNSDITFNNESMIKGWKALKQHIEEFYPDIEIISLNPVGLKGLFKDEYTDNYLESLDEKERVEINV